MPFPITPPIEPMLAKLADALPAGDFLYEPKWDGFRAIVFRGGGEVYIQSRDLRPFDRYFPDLHDLFLTALPDGYDTLVGERGAALSGGQRQRLAIARTLLRNPRILVLDEATSALDGVTEEKVVRAMKAAAAGRTTFVIAHRLATIRNADRILVFDQGRVIETGTFEELVAKGGRFAELARAQFMAGAEPEKREVRAADVVMA